MASSRSSATRLVKLFEAVAAPLYVLDREYRIVFCNAACCRWLGQAPEDLAGRQCRYHSSAESTGPDLAAAALCPPAEVFQGQRAQAAVVSPVADSADAIRTAYFLPLHSAAGEVVAVAAFVSSATGGTTGSTGGFWGGTAADDDAAALHARLAQLRRAMQTRWSPQTLVGESPAMRRVRSQIGMASAAAGSVLVVGPAGSGRQHVAKAIHYGGGTSGTLVPLECKLLSVEVLQTTIRALLRGQPPTTAGGVPSLLLNGADGLSESEQAELAGLLSGGPRLRIISTAETSLLQLAAAGKFRQDVAYLLATLVIELPPLAARLDDLPLLAQWFVERANTRTAKQVSGISAEALDVFAGYEWPGQVAELERVVTEAHVATSRAQITSADLPQRLHLAADAAAHPRRPDEAIMLDEFLGRIERELIDRALSRAKGNKTKAAHLLGMTRPRFYRRLVQLGMVEDDGESE